MAYRSDALKKTLTWSSPEIRDYLGAILKDHAAVSNRSESSLIEEALFKHFVPDNRSAQYIAGGLYTYGLAHSYEAVYHIYEAGINWASAYDNGRPMVEAMRDAMFLGGTCVDVSGCVPDLAYCHRNLRSIADYLLEFDPAAGGYLKDLISMQADEPQCCNFYNIITLILETWDWIGCKSLTYRVLAAMCRIAPTMIDDNASSRCRYLSVLKEISTIWQQ